MTADEPSRMRDPANHPLRLFDMARHNNRYSLTSFLALLSLNPLYIAAPMVRYSKLPFRQLCRDYAVDLTYTPMLLAKEFIRHPHARYTDFSTNILDTPLIAQFAANDPIILSRAAEMVSPFVDGVDLNCGCPQSWACQDGLGAGLMSNPQLVAEMVRGVKARVGTEICMSVKIRIHRDLRETVEFVRRVERMGVDFIGVHGRLKNQRSSTPPNLEAIALVKSTVRCPVVANGDVYSLEDIKKIVNVTKVDGVMSARGLLENPALYAGYETTPWGCIERYVNYALEYSSNCHIFQHHLADMTGSIFTKKETRELNELRSIVEIIDWLDDHFVLRRKDEEGYGESISLEGNRRIFD